MEINNKILVFGRTGQVATELYNQKGILSLNRNEADLSDPDSCANIIKNSNASAVINAAAYTAVDRAEEEEELATIINGASPTAMAKASSEKNIPFIHLSTDYVFNGHGTDSWSPHDSTSPINAYGRSKLAGEKGILSITGKNIIIRTSWIFSSIGENFVKKVLNLSEKSDTLRIVSDQIGGPTPASSVAAACLQIIKLLQTGVNYSGIYHFSGHPDVSWADFSREIVRQTNKKIKIIDVKSSDFITVADRPKNSTLNCQSLLQDFGIIRPDWRKGLEKVLREIFHDKT